MLELVDRVKKLFMFCESDAFDVRVPILGVLAQALRQGRSPSRVYGILQDRNELIEKVVI